MAALLNIDVAGIPAPKGSKRHVGKGRLIEASPRLKEWVERVSMTAWAATRPNPPSDKPIEVYLRFTMPRPKNTPKSARPAATKRPDLDKLTRAVLDAIACICFFDDSQVVSITAHKHIAVPDEPAGVHIRVIEAI